MKMKNRIFAIEAALSEMPVKPNIAAIIAIIRKITVQRNMVYIFSKKCLDYEMLLPATFQRISCNPLLVY